MLLGQIQFFEIRVIHDCHKVQIDGRNGVLFRTHGQRSLHNADALRIVFLEIEVMGLDIECKGPQSGRQQRQELLDGRQGSGEGQME